MASASNNPPPPPPLSVNNVVPVNHMTPVNAIPVNADAAMPVATASSTTTTKGFSHSFSE